MGKIVILNLTPFYETVSSKLKDLTDTIIDDKNIRTVEHYLQTNELVIIAWGDHPEGFYEEYELLKKRIYDSLGQNKNKVFYVNSFSLSGNPKHGQGWGYDHKLKKHEPDQPVSNNF